MKNRTPVVAANWKMNGNRQLVEQLKSELCKYDICDKVDFVFGPPATLLGYSSEVFKDCKRATLAAQNISHLEQGAFTGEVSAGMIKEMGCEWVLCGHSERRRLYDEGSRLVAKKFARAKKHGLVPVLCVGESEEERRKGKTFSRLTAQIEAVLNEVGCEGFQNSIIAYEPIWAVGTGKAATPEIAQEAHKFIRNMISAMSPSSAETVRILYGGSVKPENAASLFSQPDIDGGLIGGAALVPEQFRDICLSAVVE